MTHDRAWERLPDLLGPHEDVALLAHVANCHACQRQLFLLGRVDRMLRAARPNGLSQRRRFASLWTASLITTIAAAAAIAIVLFLPRSPAAQAFVLRAADGRALGRATIVQREPSRAALALVARGMIGAEGGQLVLWARTSEGAGPIPVGRFMVDWRGDCRARFTLPSTHHWLRFWVTSSSDPSRVVATT